MPNLSQLVRLPRINFCLSYNKNKLIYSSLRNMSSIPNKNASAPSLPEPVKMFSNAKLDVWTMFNIAAAKSGAVNLGQGFMNFPAPDLIKNAGLACIANDNCTQYSPPRGRPRLLKALAERYGKSIGRNINPETEVMVTTGANEGIFCALLAFIDKDARNEAIIIEPAFDQYTPNIIMAGGKAVNVPLRVNPDLKPEVNIISSNEWKLDMAELEAAITPKTKIIILNTPQNPTGKIFSYEELISIADLAKKYNLLVISDEVYENLYYDNQKHISISSIPGMFDRTLIVGSMGKLFGVTGWRIGWVVGAQQLINPCLAAHTRTVFVSPSPQQEAGGMAFEKASESNFFDVQREEYIGRRKKLMDAFDSVGLPYSIPHGSYFLLVNASRVRIPKDFHIPDYVSERGRSFELCYFFTVHIGLGCIPPTEFYSEEHVHLAEDYVRFAFCKSDDVFEEATKRLAKLKQYIE
ncbi:hypothetical protein BB558_001000 [Smittium angustum]|uniref:Aminotransferase class I/classII large domain-containing protein n=1 Tax=Smittium angustum TaxID=133377 RepID=A0A2U1JCM4_SMIAN|nr:hypothetical protein BB558_001000 [Smittium angustum]